MSNTTLSDRIRPEWQQPHLVWLIPFAASAIYLASDYYSPINWQFAARVGALIVVLALVVYEGLCLHSIHQPESADRIVSRYFLVSCALALLLLVTRFLIPVPSTPDNNASRINALLNAWLLIPFAVLSIYGVWLVAVSRIHRQSQGLYCGLILVVTLLLSMESSSRSVLRSMVRVLPYSRLL